MTRSSFYSFAIFFTGVYIATVLFQAVTFMRLGARMYELPSLQSWIVVAYGVTLAWMLVMLKYYHQKQFRFTFWCLTASIIASLFQFYLFYNLITTREIGIPYLVTTLVHILTGMLYAVSLIVSAAGQRPWLRIAGFFLFLLEVGMMTSFAWAILSVAARVNGTIETMEQWISMASGLIPILFILNFLAERRTKDKQADLKPGALTEMMAAAALLIFIPILIFFPKFARESFRSADHPDEVSGYLKSIANAFEARTFVNHGGDSLQFRLMIPFDYDSAKQYPLVVCLHGSSAVGNDNVKQVAATLPAQLLSTTENRKKYPAFLFVPQCPRGYGWGGLSGQPSIDSLVFEAMADLEKEFRIDAKRRYVTGYSMGGYGTWHFIATRPDMFAAAVPMCGAGDPQFAKNIVDIPIWAFHGAKDINVPVSGSRDIIEAMRNHGGNPRYTEFPEAAHNIWVEVRQTTELPGWLFAQKRE